MNYRRCSLGLLAGLLLWPAVAQAWWSDEWTARKPLRIDTSAAGANITEPIGSTPVLLRLHAGNFRFEQAKEDGSDLRFVAGDDKTPLPFHVEKYDSLLGEALIWIGLPELKSGAKTELWLYFHNPKAVAAEDAKATYDKSTLLVYHFAERGPPPRDSSVWANHALTAGATAEGALIGSGLRLDGSGAITVPAGPSLSWAAGAKITWSAWVRPADAESTGVVFSRRDGATAFVVGVDKGAPYVEVSGEGAAAHQRANATAPLAAGSWHQITVTAGESIALFVDGAPAAKLATALPALNGTSTIGGDPQAAAKAPAAEAAKRTALAPPVPPQPGFKGDLDELQLAKVERPPGFISFAAISQGTDPGKLLVAGQDEETSGAGTGYLAVILRSVTLDGWVVIGLLAIMAAVSWMVMVGKTTQLGAVERANDLFTTWFRKQGDDLVELISGSAGTSSALPGDRRTQGNSTLFHLFQVAGEEVRKRTAGGRPLSAEALESIRASIDGRLVRENQLLNQRMVLLTIAISGGPFLGLLGTVVGVMITFAAIAAAGDVNVNAIAPGIAAALVATVAGLAVAIPALFGYNWLLTKVKNIVATQQVFVDELVTRLAESHGDRNGRSEKARPTIVAQESAS
jgi:biopolymer transport protein ExbB